MMEIDGLPVVAPAAPAGSGSTAARSCATCAKAKAKCERIGGRGVCERCARLGKECQMREPTLRRRRTGKASRAAQLEKLENKIEHLVNALSTSQAQKGFSPEVGQPSPPVSLKSASERANENSAGLDEGREHDGCFDDCASPPPHDCQIHTGAWRCSNDLNFPAAKQNNNDCPHVVHNGHPTPASTTPTTALSMTEDQWDHSTLGVSVSEADVLLDRYRRLMAANFPFVRVDPDATALQLYAQKPLLLHAIIAVTYFHDLPTQKRFAKLLMRDISERILMNGERTLDIVQGILVFSAWYHPHFFWGQQIFNILSLASSIVAALGIDRRIFACPSDLAGMTPRLAESSEARRALAGLFYMTSMLSSVFRKSDAIRYSDAVTAALEKLEQDKEHEDDLFLVQMVRVQHIIEQTTAVASSSAPATLYVKAFTADLERLRATNPSPEPTNSFLLLQYATAEVCIHKLSLNAVQTTTTTTNTNPPNPTDPNPLTPHLPSLHALTTALQTLFNDYFTHFPAHTYLLQPFSLFASFAHAFLILVRLYALDIPGWSPATLQSTLPFGSISDAGSDRFEAATRSSPDGLRVNNDSFARWAQRARLQKHVFESRMGGASAASALDVERAQHAGLSPQNDICSGLEVPERSGPNAPHLKHPQQHQQQQQQSQQSQQPQQHQQQEDWLGMERQPPHLAGGVLLQGAQGQVPGQMQGPMQPLQQPPLDEYLSGDFFSDLNESFWQGLAGDLAGDLDLGVTGVGGADLGGMGSG